MLVKCALDSKRITDSVTSKASPYHNTSSSMLYSGKNTCWDHPFTHTASHKDTAVGTKNHQFGHNQNDSHSEERGGHVYSMRPLFSLVDKLDIQSGGGQWPVSLYYLGSLPLPYIINSAKKETSSHCQLRLFSANLTCVNICMNITKLNNCDINWTGSTDMWLTEME